MFDYAEWVAEQQREHEMRKAEAIEDARRDPDSYDVDDMQDRYDNERYGKVDTD